MRSIFLSKNPSKFLSRTPIRDKNFKGFLDGKKTSIMARVIYFGSLTNPVK